MNKIFCIVMPIILCSCADKAKDYDVYVSRDFSQDEFAQISSAASEWETKSKYDVVFNFHYQDDNASVDRHKIIVAKSTFSYIDDVMSDSNAIGFTSEDPVSDTGYIYFPSLYLLGYKSGPTIKHEFGHALGLVHSGQGTIMYYRFDPDTQNVSCADISQLTRVRDEHYFTCDGD